MRNIARFVLGLVFVFSGFVKAIDPVGSGLIFSEYFKAFGVDFLQPLSVGFGVILSTLELLLGIIVLLDFRKLWGAWGMLLFMSFFTLLTLILAVFNPVHDCGCFGEAIKLTNWQTFFKNVALWPFVLLLFRSRHHTLPLASGWAEWPVIALFAALIVSLSLYCYRHQPLMDFMGFKVGNNIPQLLEESRQHPEFTYQTTLIYAKDGKEAAFNIDQLPDSTWTYVDSKTKEIPTGYHPKIASFSVRDLNGNQVEDALLQDPRTALVFTITAAKHVQALERASALVEHARQNDLPVYVLSAVDTAQLSTALLLAGMEDVPVYYVDVKTLLSMARNSPSLLALRHGTVLAKYPWRDFPSLTQWETLLSKDPEIAAADTRIHNRLRMEIMAAGALLLIFLLRKGFWFSRTTV